MSTRTWLSKWFGTQTQRSAKVRRGANPKAGARRCRPILEALEDRLTPSSYTGAGNTWMSLLQNDHVSLSQLSIPGTHDTMTYLPGGLAPTVRTQTLSLTDQLNIGIRFLDIRVGPGLFGDLGLYHSLALGGSFNTDVVATCEAFLKAHPSETIVMSIQHDNGKYAPIYDAVNSHVTGSDKDYWYSGNTVPTLGEVRGKIVLVSSNGSLAQRDSDDHAVSGGTVLGIPIGLANNTAGERSGVFYVENMYEFPGASTTLQEVIGQKEAIVRSALTKAQSETTDSAWYLSFTSAAARSDGDALAQILNGINPRSFAEGTVNQDITGVNQFLEGLNFTGRVGTVPMDFVRESVSRLVIGANFSNAAPSDISLSNARMPENNRPGDWIGSFSTTDLTPAAAPRTYTYTLVPGAGDADNGTFYLDHEHLGTRVVFNAEEKSSYSIRVRSTDSGGLFFEKTFTIGVTDVNEAPTDITLTNASVPENQSAGTVVGDIIPTDLDGPGYTSQLVSGPGDTDNASFTMFLGHLKTARSFDFETQSSYSVRVQSTDSLGLSFQKVFTISVTNVNEAPTDISLSRTLVAQDQPAGTVFGDLSTTDPDAGDTFTYSVSGGSGAFTLAAGGQFKTATSHFDASSYFLTVTSTDAGGLSFTKEIVIHVAGPITGVTPSGGVLTPGTVVPITWNPTSFSGFVDVAFSLDGGHSFTPIATRVLGSTSWTVPDFFTTQGEIRVAAASGVPVGYSATPFAIIPPLTNVTAGGSVLVPGERTTISWTNPAGFAGQVELEYSVDGGSTWKSIGFSVPLLPPGGPPTVPVTYTFAWTPPDYYTTHGLIRVHGSSPNTPGGVSATFTIDAPIRDIQPGGAPLIVGRTATITWSYPPGWDATHGDLIAIRYSPAAGQTGTYGPVLGLASRSTTSFTWTVPNQVTAQGLLAVFANSAPRAAGFSDLFTVSNPPSAITVVGGDGQSASVASPTFARPLAVQVVDQNGLPAAGVNVTFTSPGILNGVFSGSFGLTTTVATDGAGRAFAEVRPGARAGTYAVTAAVDGLPGLSAGFTLTNTPGAPHHLSSAGGGQVQVGETPATPLSVTVFDQFNNPVPQVPVVFTAPATGPSGSFDGQATTTVPTDAFGVAAVQTFTANFVVGAYAVTAAVAGTPLSATIALTNSYPAPTVTALGAGGVFNGLRHAATATVTGANNVVLASDASNPAVHPEALAYAYFTMNGAPLVGAPIHVGTYLALAHYQGQGGYPDADSGPVVYSITAATPTVHVTAASGTYNGSPYAATASVAGVDGSFGGSLEGVTPTLSYYAGPTLLSGAPTHAGTYTVVASFAGSQNYTIASASATFVITPAVLTVKANNAEQTYGSANPAFSSTMTGFVNGDGPGQVSGTPSLTTTATAASEVGAYPIVAGPGSLSALDYVFAFADGLLNVKRAALTVQVTSPGPVNYGQPVTFTARVIANAPGSSTPTGTVSFYDGTTLLGSRTLSGGVATFTVVKPSAGSHSITVRYGGDANFLAATSAAYTQVVASAAQQTQALVNQVNSLVKSRVLDSLSGQVMTVLLNLAGSSFQAGRPAVGVIQLRVFLVLLNTEVQRHKLTAVQAQPLIDATNQAIASALA